MKWAICMGQVSSRLVSSTRDGLEVLAWGCSLVVSLIGKGHLEPDHTSNLCFKSYFYTFNTGSVVCLIRGVFWNTVEYLTTHYSN